MQFESSRFRKGEAVQALRVQEGYRDFQLSKTLRGQLRLASDSIVTADKTNSVDVSWLPFSAEQYLISADINDYIICDVPIVHVAIPNRNMDEFPFEEVTRFDPELGRLVYQSFIGKPTHMDHDNKDIRKAKGVIFDARLDKLGSGLYTIRILAGFDRTKDRNLTEDIMSGRRPGHSMGALVGYTKCSYPGCEITSTTGKLPCPHMEGSIGKGRNIGGQLIYERCYNVRYIESSSVGDQANWFATQEWAK